MLLHTLLVILQVDYRYISPILFTVTLNTSSGFLIELSPQQQVHVYMKFIACSC